MPLPDTEHDRAKDEATSGPAALRAAGVLSLLAVAALGADPAAAQSAAEVAARKTIAAFIAGCGPAVTDPSAAVSAVASRPGMVHASSPDARVLVMGYPVEATADQVWEAYVTYEIAAVGPGAWIVTCNAISYYREDVLGLPGSATGPAFEAVIDSMPGLQKVGGTRPESTIGETDDISVSQSLYVVTGWWDADPTLHMWAEMGDFGFDLWVQHSVRRP